MFTTGNYKIVFKKRWHDKRRPLSKDLRESKAVKMPETDGRYDTVVSSLSFVCRPFVKMPETDGRYDTVCEIYRNDGTKEVPRYAGIAKLHPNDHVDRVVGKKVALQYALKEIANKDYRTMIWKAFWSWVSQWPNQVGPKPITQKPRKY